MKTPYLTKCTILWAGLKPASKKKPIPKVGNEKYEDGSLVIRGVDKDNPMSLDREHMHQHGRELKKAEVYALNVPMDAETRRRARAKKRLLGSYSDFADPAVLLRESLSKYGLEDLLSELELVRRNTKALESGPLTRRRKVVLTKEAHEAAERMAQSGEDPRAFLRELTLVRERLYDRKEQRWINFVDYVIEVVKMAKAEAEQWSDTATSSQQSSHLAG